MVSSAVTSPMQPARLAAGELGDVRVLLLRHDRRSGGVGVVDLDPAELVRRPEHDLLAEPGQVHACERRREAEFGGEVPVGDGVHRVRRGAVEAELGRQQLGVDRQRRPGERARAERADRGAPVPVAQPADVTRERLHVGEQLVREQHRLRVLHVRHARRGQVPAGVRLGDQRGLQLDEPADDEPGVVTQVQPQVGGYLVVAAAAGAQLAAEGTEPLEQATLERGVHVLVGHRGPERSLLHRGVEVVERLEHRVGLAVAEQSRPVQHSRVRAGREQVVAGQPPVELNAQRQPRQGVRGAALKPPAPQARRPPL